MLHPQMRFLSQSIQSLHTHSTGAQGSVVIGKYFVASKKLITQYTLDYIVAALEAIFSSGRGETTCE